jgi:hypothetical protein
MDIQKVLQHQINISRFNGIDSLETKRNLLVAFFKQVKHKQNIFKEIIDEQTRHELQLQVEVDGYKFCVDNMTADQLNEEFEKLIIEDRSFQTESNEKLKQHWGL